MESLLTKYRPKSFDDVVGHNAVITSLKNIINKRTSIAFLYHGAAGTGKTTLARITANQLCAEDIIEIDAALFSGVDYARDIVTLTQGNSLISSARAIIIDECHLLSKTAWAALLKSVEEPSSKTYWLFCTTDFQKVPTAITTRCSCFNLKSVETKELAKLVMNVAKQENWNVSKQVLSYIIAKADGSPRQALSNLGLVSECVDAEQARQLLIDEYKNTATIELCRALARGASWADIIAILKGLKDAQITPEGIRLAVFGYFAVVAQKAKDDRAAINALKIMHAFKEPLYNSNDSFNRLVLMLGEVKYAEN